MSSYLYNPIADRALDLAEPLTRSVERARAEAGDLDALVLSNLRLVQKIVRQNSSYGVSREDLFAEGVLGLCEAARRFDPSTGYRFESYALWYVKAWIWHFIARNRQITRSANSRAGRTLIQNMRRVERRLRQERFEEPTASDVAAALNVTADDVLRMRHALSGSDLVIVDAEQAFRGGYAPRTEATQFEELAAARGQLQIADAVASLSKERCRVILQQRYLREPPVTLQTIATEWGISRERVRQIELEAFDDLIDTGVFGVPFD